jgi:hypothetical protein
MLGVSDGTMEDISLGTILGALEGTSKAC